MTDPKRGFDLAFVAIAEAADFEAAESHLGHAMEDLYRLYELAKQPPLTKALREAALVATDRRQDRFGDCVGSEVSYTRGRRS